MVVRILLKHHLTKEVKVPILSDRKGGDWGEKNGVRGRWAVEQGEAGSENWTDWPICADQGCDRIWVQISGRKIKIEELCNSAISCTGGVHEDSFLKIPAASEGMVKLHAGSE